MENNEVLDLLVGLSGASCHFKKAKKMTTYITSENLWMEWFMHSRATEVEGIISHRESSEGFDGAS